MTTTHSQPFDPSHVLEHHLSAPRLAPYLAIAGTTADAIRLYRWGAELNGALHQAIGHVEVAVRNSIDRQLRVWNAGRPPDLRNGVGQYSSSWIETPARPLWSLLNTKVAGGRTLSAFDTAYRRCRSSAEDRPASHPRHRAAVVHDDLVANLTFGVWLRLLPDPSAPQSKQRVQKVLWDNAVRKAFGYHQDPDVVYFWVSRVHRLRNRVAHHEPLIDLDVQAYHRTMVRLLRAIDPVLGDWFSGASPVPGVLRSRPV